MVLVRSKYLRTVLFLLTLYIFTCEATQKWTNQVPRSIRNEIPNRVRTGFLTLITTLPVVASASSGPSTSASRSFPNVNPRLKTDTTIKLTKEKKDKTVKDEGDGFVSGLISGAVSRASKEILLHPIDTVRARQQIYNNNNTDNNALYTDLYEGIVPALVGGIPAGAIFFGCKDYAKKQLRALGFSKEVATILSVTIANFPYWIIRNPSEVLKTRQQVQQTVAPPPSTTTTTTSASSFTTAAASTTKSNDAVDVTEIVKDQRYDNAYANFQAMIETEGSVVKALSKLYASYSSNVAYALPADLVKFLVYEYLSTQVLKKGEGEKMEALEAAITGAVAGLVAQAVTTPLDVARTRIMSSDRGGEDGTETDDGAEGGSVKSSFIARQDNPISMMEKIVREEGIQALGKGFAPRAVRALASGAIQFASYELSQNVMKSS